MEASRDGETLAESELAQARRRYEAGVATSVEVIDAQTRLQFREVARLDEIIIRAGVEALDDVELAVARAEEDDVGADG